MLRNTGETKHISGICMGSDKMKSVRDKIRDGAYDSTVQYPTKPRKPRLASGATAAEARAYADEVEAYGPAMEAFATARAAYYADEDRLAWVFRRDLEEENGVPHDHPKAQMLWDKSYEQGHSSGLSEIANVYDDLSELVV